MKKVHIDHGVSPKIGQQLPKSTCPSGWLSEGPGRSGRRQRGPVKCIAMVTAPVSTLPHAKLLFYLDHLRLCSVDVQEQPCQHSQEGPP